MSRLRLIAALAVPLAAAALTGAAAQTVPEAELKAAFIYNFAVFTEWPPETLGDDGRFHICVAADSPLRQALGRLSGRPVHERSVLLQEAAPPVWAQPGCHIAVLDGGPAPDNRRAVLTVANGAPDGAMIRLLLQDEHLRFDVDAGVARRAQLEFSSKLLRLARDVR